MKILIKGKVETVSIDQVKPAHFECEPDHETCREIKGKTQPNTMHSKTAEITRGTRRDQKRSSSTFTSKSVRTGVEPHPGTKTQSSMPSIGTSLAITLQSQATRANSSRQPKPYIVPHSRTPAVSRANGTMTVCERIPEALLLQSPLGQESNRTRVQRHSL